MAKFPPPNDTAYMMIDGVAVPVEDIPPDEWAVYEQKMLDNISKALGEYHSERLARGE